MKHIASCLAACAAVAALAFSACSGNGRQTAATAGTDTAANAASEAAAPVSVATSGDAVTEVATNTPDLDAYNGRLTVVDFNAVWCGPCRKYGPTFHAVAEQMKDVAVFLSVNVDSCQEIATKYVGPYIPQTTVIRPNGEYVSKAGQLSEQELKAFIDSVAALD